MAAPTTQVEVAFNTGVSGTPDWRDLTPWVRVDPGINIGHWRDVEDDETQASRCSMVLINNDGRFTPGKSGSPYYPNVKRNRPLRVRGRTSADGNLLTANQASFETSVADWESNTLFGTYTAASSITRVNTHPQAGSWGMLATWPTTAIGSWVDTLCITFVIGRTYTVSAYVWVPSGSPDPRMEVAFVASGSRTSTKNAMARISCTFTATATTHFIGVQVATASSGNQCYVDAVQVDEGPNLRTFTTSAPVAYDRFNGYVDDWVVDWPATVSTANDCSVSASSGMARQGRGTELKSVIFEEWTRDGSAAYYPLDGYSETSGAGFTQLYQTGPAPWVSFDGTGPATDSASAAMFHAGRRLEGVVSIPVNTATHDLWWECTINTTQGGGSDIGLGGLLGATAADDFEVVLATGGGIGGSMGDANAGYLAPTAVNDGLTHHILVVGNDTDDVRIYIDGALDYSYPFAPNINSTFTLVTIGDNIHGGGNPLNGTLSNVNIGTAPIGTLTAARVADHATAVLDGFAGELPGARLARYAAYGNLSATDYAFDTGVAPMAHIDTTGATVLEMMRKVETTDGGVLFDALDGKLTYADRDSRYGTTAAFTVSYSAGEVANALRFVMDDQQQVNDMTAMQQSLTGNTVARQFDQTSIDTHGYYRETIELNTTDDTEPANRAGWVVSRYAEPSERVSDVEVLLNTASGTLVAGVLSAQVGTRVTLSGLPSNAPASSMDLFIEGRAETITASEDRVLLHTSPAGLFDVFVLGTSLLDGASSLGY